MVNKTLMIVLMLSQIFGCSKGSKDNESKNVTELNLVIPKKLILSKNDFWGGTGAKKSSFDSEYSAVRLRVPYSAIKEVKPSLKKSKETYFTAILSKVESENKRSPNKELIYHEYKMEAPLYKIEALTSNYSRGYLKNVKFRWFLIDNKKKVMGLCTTIGAKSMCNMRLQYLGYLFEISISEDDYIDMDGNFNSGLKQLLEQWKKNWNQNKLQK